MAQVIGYARVSTEDQDCSIQEEALRKAGASVVRAEKRSGTGTQGREALATVLEFIDEGDTLLVTRIDRLARSVADLEGIVQRLREKGAHLKATDQPIDTSSAAGRAFLQMLGVFAEFETAIRRERQMEGIAKAKAAGVYKGRKPKVKPEQVQELLAQGMRPADVARELGVARSTVYLHRGRGNAAA